MCLAVFLLVSFLSATSQDLLSIKLDGSETGKPLAEVLKEIEKKDTVRFYFLPDWLDPFTFSEPTENVTLGEALNDFVQGTDLSFFLMDVHTLVFIKDPTQMLNRKYAIENAVRRNRKIEPYVMGKPENQQSRVTISGRVTDTQTGEPLIRVTIRVNESQQVVTTDNTGGFSVTFPAGAYVLTFGFVNYDTKVIDLVAYEDGTVDIQLTESGRMLQEVVVVDQYAREVATRRIGETQLVMSDIKRAPSLLGVADLIKQVQSLPGVTTVGEAALGFNVRGGSVDQNLILYDGMPAFNSAHVFGFFSAFNPDAIRDVTFYKGGVPAEFGGRASSVLNIQSKDADYNKWNGNAGIGLVAANFMINGPIQKEKTSIAASFRSSYSDWLVHAVRTDYADLSNSSVFFYDGTLKLTHLFNDRTKLSLTGYSSQDRYQLVGDSTYNWNNFQVSGKVNHQFSNSLSSELVAGVSKYGYSVENEDYLTASKLSYQIISSVLKAGFNYYKNPNHKWNFGWQFTHYNFSPGMLEPTSPVSNARYISFDQQYSIENAFYVADEITLGDNLFVEGGLRLPMFTSLGPATVNIYDENLPREAETITDSVRYGRGEIIKTYVGIEPRLSFRWMVRPSASVKLGYNRMYQYLHLVTNTTAVTPVDIWQPSGYYVKPQRADQISIGYFADSKDKEYAFSVELFYKWMKNILDFKDGAQLILNNHLETDLLQGKGMSYGVENSFTKNTGRFTFSLNYTYARSFRVIDGPAPTEKINQGEKYPSNYDQPHIANLSWKYNLARRVFFTGSFTYHTGRPVTIPLSAFAWENTSVAYFSKRNQYRIPDYHRLDLALVIEGSNKREKRWTGTWVFSIYNVYGRTNPYTVFFKNAANNIPVPYQLSIIGTVFPSISYNIKF